jgi:(p)ppGpp synthase/HD superfamily hydrolase
MEDLILTTRFSDALVIAAQLHVKQRRKGSKIPYIAHLLGVTALVLEDGGDENQAIAALLHDAVEDQGGIRTLQMIEEKFGGKVAAIVDGCSDTYIDPKPDWRARKEIYLERLKTASVEILRVSLADKLHNAKSILRNLEKEGDSIWSRFNGAMDGTIWYYQSALEIFQSRIISQNIDELSLVLEQIKKISEENRHEV